MGVESEKAGKQKEQHEMDSTKNNGVAIEPVCDSHNSHNHTVHSPPCSSPPITIRSTLPVPL